MRWICGILTLFVIIYLSSVCFGAPTIRFSIVYTNDVMGEVEPCG